MPRPALALPLLLALAACAPSPRPRAAVARPASPVIAVELPPAPAEAPLAAADDEEPAPPRPRPCVIAGAGERRLPGSESPFEIFMSPGSAAPAAIVQRTTSVKVTWSELPGVRGGRRAKVALGGQKLLRLSGWASLEGRGFQIRRRAEVHAEHVWVRGGSAVEIIGVQGGRLRVRSATGLAAPVEVDAVTSCEDLAYEPIGLPRPADEAPPKGIHAINTGARLDLHAGPGGQRLMGLVTENGRGDLNLQWLEARDGYVRVAGENGNLAFDAWAPASQVEQPHGISGRGISFGCGGVVSRFILARAVHDAEVTVGDAPGGPVIGVLEAEAEVTTGEERGDYVAFSLAGREIEPPEGKVFWVLKSALGIK